MSSLKHHILADLRRRKSDRQPAFAVLADPDNLNPSSMAQLAAACNTAGVDYLLMGGSLVLNSQLDACIQQFKATTDIPVILFPGAPSQVSAAADALLFLSLISGRNADLLIGQHVISAPSVRASGLEVIGTGYMVVDGGVPTTVSYMSHAAPIPANKPDIALCTAWAGEMLGLQALYLDAGSGAQYPISETMIQRLSTQTVAPLFVGGGIRSAEGAYLAAKSGATVVVVGNALEANPALMQDMSAAVHAASGSTIS
ncbi:MAG: geranylgeranylglyceryl/heptaprenylglyceryl phosphate synthase [Bacteroidetes bacterium]|nr:geranylgeranylglyceryl/heptaprenylglyceryl phosphate synthase [Bacteroidota bacterium]